MLQGYAGLTEVIDLPTGGTTNQVLTKNSNADFDVIWATTSGTLAYNNITSGTNTTAAMVVGTGASLATSGSGTIVATTITSRTIGGVAYDGSANITVASATGGFAVSGGNMTVAGTDTVTSTSATAFSAGANGATNPSFNVDNSTSSQVGGISVKGGATGGTTTITATDSGSNQSLTIASKGSGQLTLAGSGSATAIQAASATQITVGTSQTSFTNTVRSSTANTAHLFTGLASGTGGNSLTAGSEVNSFFANYAATQTHASNTAITLQRDVRITGSTHAYQTATGTITDAATLAVAGGPIAGTNCAITNSSTIYSAGSNVASGTTNSYGLNITANTGATNNYAHQFIGAGGTLNTLRTDGQITYLATNTTVGTTGNQTINKPSGTVNIAAAGTTVTVTNSLCATTSIVFAVIRTNDTTARIANVVPGAGSFVINIVACTAEVSIGFWVIN